MKPKETRAVVFFILVMLCLLEFGNAIREISIKNNVTGFIPENPIFSIVHAKNTGGAFGIFQNSTLPLAIFGIIILVILFVRVYKFVDFNQKIRLLAISIFAGGILGNVVERLRFFHVIDYIKLNFVDFAIFNAFDIMINIGIILYLIYIAGDEWKKTTKKK